MSVTPNGSLDESSQRTWDAVVIGAGPAGSMAARELARRNVSVLLIDSKSFPRPKVCGGCLNSHAIGLLEEFGLGDLPIRLGGSPLREIEFRAAARSLVCKLPGGVSISRERLDAALVEAAMDSGATFLDQTTATIEPELERGCRVIDVSHPHGNGRILARTVVGADGLLRLSVKQLPEMASHVAAQSRIGIGAVVPLDDVSDDILKLVPPGRVVMNVSDDGYVGLSRAEQGLLSIGAAVCPERLKQAVSTSSLASAMLRETNPSLTGDLPESLWHGTPPLSSQPLRRCIPGVFLIGDAAGYVEPFTGEGMAWGFEGAMAVAPFVQAALSGWKPMLESRWEQMFQARIGRSQTVCRWVSRILRRPVATSLAIRAAGAFPSWTSHTVARVSSVRRRLESVSS